MRFYPNDDFKNYWEIPPTCSADDRSSHKTWKRRNPQEEHTIFHWRDLEGAKMPFITKKDLYFNDWPKGRIRSFAVLPYYYCVGNRFVLLEKSFPANYGCAKLPMNLKEKRDLKKYEKQLANNQQLNEIKANKSDRKVEKLEKKKNRRKGKKEANKLKFS